MLSAEAAAVLDAVQAVSTEHPGETREVSDPRNRAAVARAWEAGRRNPTIAAEIDRFEKAAEQRLRVDRLGRPIGCTSSARSMAIRGILRAARAFETTRPVRRPSLAQ